MLDLWFEMSTFSPSNGSNITMLDFSSLSFTYIKEMNLVGSFLSFLLLSLLVKLNKCVLKKENNIDINNGQAEKEIRIAIPFPIASEKMLGINFIKLVKDLYNKNYKTLKKEIEEDTLK
jgi:hypothetical protein